MDSDHPVPAAPARNLEPLLEVTRRLAAPFDLATMLAAVVDAATAVLEAERATVWLHDAATGQFVLEVGRGIEPVRIPADAGLVGSCARGRAAINVPDCYADPRFNPDMDRRTGYRTRCMLTLPLIDHQDVLVGVLQVLNRRGGVFDRDDEALAGALAAQCAVALARVRMTAALIEGEKMRQQLEMARQVQLATLPAAMPAVPGYDVHAAFRPADFTGGDTYDLALTDRGLLVVLGDATGHGLAPALHVTQMHAMLRMALRMGADLERAFHQLNNQLADTLPDDRFITAFIGLLDPAAHRLRFLSGGQAPILIWRAAAGTCEQHGPTGFPLAALPLAAPPAAVSLDLGPGDILVLLSDGILEYHDARGEQFGLGRALEVIGAHRDEPMAALSAHLLAALAAFAGSAPQEDDITLVLVRRGAPAGAVRRRFARDYAALADIFAYTASTFAALGIPDALRHDVDFTIEELFTNMVKYSTMSQAEPEIALAPAPGGVVVTLRDFDVDRFDVTAAPDADVAAPIEERRPGGLGLHLIRRIVDSIEYDYSAERRESRTTFKKTQAGAPHPGNGANRGG